MLKLKKMIVEKYLPSWCRVELMEENKRLEERNRKQAIEIERLNSYIDGMHDALKYRQKIAINGRGDIA